VARLSFPLLGLILAAATFAGCGGADAADAGGDGPATSRGSSSEGGTAAEAPDDVVVVASDPAPVTALDNTFTPENIQVEVGTQVVWTNKGRNEHNALHVDGDGWGVEVDDFQPGDVYAHRFDQPGVYRYYCSIHGTTDAGMIGTVVVTE
jgi:plastocyanin